MTLQEQNKLLYARAGFGISLEDYRQPRPIKDCVAGLFPPATPGRLEMISAEEWAENSPKAMKELTDEVMRKEKQKTFRERAKDLNQLWIQAMVEAQYPLLEKMSIFWHGHFATRTNNPYFDQLLLNDIRQNALANFGDMLKAVSKSPAMLQFLNNQQNKKAHPNENFAREVMELFTLGRGHYTEQDIKEAARAFTGWAYDGYGMFVFHKGQHDDGEKQVLGRKGNWNGDDILNILLEQKQTAVFISQKLYRYFVSDEKIDDKHVQQMARHFYESNYDIAALLKHIFTANWFYDDHVKGAKVKAPVELLVGYQRLLPIEFRNQNTVTYIQRVLGQHLFNPPNVAGWPGGKNWIDSSSLVIRMQLPQALFMSKELNLDLKPTEQEIAMMHNVNQNANPGKNVRIGQAVADWNNHIVAWKEYSMAELPKAMAEYLLPVAVSDAQQKALLQFCDRDNEEDYIKSISILLMGMPEYQLC